LTLSPLHMKAWFPSLFFQCKPSDTPFINLGGFFPYPFTETCGGVFLMTVFFASPLFFFSFLFKKQYPLLRKYECDFFFSVRTGTVERSSLFRIYGNHLLEGLLLGVLYFFSLTQDCSDRLSRNFIFPFSSHQDPSSSSHGVSWQEELFFSRNHKSFSRDGMPPPDLSHPFLFFFTEEKLFFCALQSEMICELFFSFFFFQELSPLQ